MYHHVAAVGLCIAERRIGDRQQRVCSLCARGRDDAKADGHVNLSSLCFDWTSLDGRAKSFTCCDGLICGSFEVVDLLCGRKKEYGEEHDGQGASDLRGAQERSLKGLLQRCVIFPTSKRRCTQGMRAKGAEFPRGTPTEKERIVHV